MMFDAEHWHKLTVAHSPPVLPSPYIGKVFRYIDKPSQWCEEAENQSQGSDAMKMEPRCAAPLTSSMTTLPARRPAYGTGRMAAGVPTIDL